MPRSTPVGTNSGLRLSDLPHLSPRTKDTSWDPSISNTFQERRNGSVSAPLPDAEVRRLEEEKLPKATNSGLPIEERLALLEEKISQLKSSTG
jgi:hypothetical protein